MIAEAKRRQLSPDRREELQFEAEVNIETTIKMIEDLHRDAYPDVLDNNFVRKEIARHIIAWAMEFRKPQKSIE